MGGNRTNQIAVIFINQRTGDDDAGYEAAALEMDTLAAVQPGYCGIDTVRSPDGAGITVSYWSDEASAKAWKDNAQHAAIRERGRGVWYDSYEVIVAKIERNYAWQR